MLNQSVAESDEPLRLTVSGREHAPGLIRYLESQRVQLKFESLSEQAARDAVRAGSAQVILIVPEEYGTRVHGRAPCAGLAVRRQRGLADCMSADRARLLLAGYGSGIAQLRLQVRGVSPLLAMPVAVNDIDVATPTGRAVVSSDS